MVCLKHITWAYVTATKAKQNKMVDVCIVPSASQNWAAVSKSNFWSGLIYFALTDSDKAARWSQQICYGPSQSHDKYSRPMMKGDNSQLLRRTRQEYLY